MDNKARFLGWAGKPTNLITREIGIDMGHRVTNHGSKCRNIHGHRYTIVASLEGGLVESGEEEGMVQDFSFIKDTLMVEIDVPCDHGLCLWVQDPLLKHLPGLDIEPEHMQRWIDESVANMTPRRQGILTTWAGGKLYVLDKVPTAENLAAHWYGRLEPKIDETSKGNARLYSVKVWETPNCSAEYIG